MKYLFSGPIFFLQFCQIVTKTDFLGKPSFITNTSLVDSISNVEYNQLVAAVGNLMCNGLLAQWEMMPLLIGWTSGGRSLRQCTIRPSVLPPPPANCSPRLLLLMITLFKAGPKKCSLFTGYHIQDNTDIIQAD